MMSAPLVQVLVRVVADLNAEMFELTLNEEMSAFDLHTNGVSVNILFGGEVVWCDEDCELDNVRPGDENDQRSPFMALLHSHGSPRSASRSSPEIVRKEVLLNAKKLARDFYAVGSVK